MATAMTLIKRFPYRGNTAEEWSNKYHLTGSTPATAADWLALFNALAAQEKTLYKLPVQIVRAYGYDSDASTANNVWSRDLTAIGNTPIDGTLVTSGAAATAGDTAAWIRWKTSRLSSPGGKPIYLRKYYHPAYANTTDYDQTVSAWRTAAAAFGTKMIDGTFLDARTLRAPGQTSETFLGSSVSQYVTVRTLKRRGKRPNS